MCMPRSNNQIKSLRCGKTETDWNLVRTWKMRFEKRIRRRWRRGRWWKKQQLSLHMTLSVQSMSMENFAAFNKQAIKLTTTAAHIHLGRLHPFRLSHFDFYTITFGSDAGWGRDASHAMCRSFRRVFFSVFLFFVLPWENSISVLCAQHLRNIICFLVQWGENNIDKRSIRIS